MSFWTCGPFKEAIDRAQKMAFKAEQMKLFLELLEEDQKNKELLTSGSLDEKLIAQMVQLDIDKKVATILGIPDGHEETNDEISREALLESIRKGTEDKA